MSTVEVTIDDKTLRMPARFYHMVAKLRTVMDEFSFEMKVGKVYCLFTAEYDDLEESEEEGTDSKKAETPHSSPKRDQDDDDTEIAQLLTVQIHIDQTIEVFEGEEFWDQFLAVNTKESKNVKPLGKFSFKDNDSGMVIRRAGLRKSDPKGSIGATYIEIGTDPKKPLVRIPFDDRSLATLTKAGVSFHPNVVKLLSFI